MNVIIINIIINNINIDFITGNIIINIAILIY